MSEETGILKRASYRNFGNQLQQDIIAAEFEVGGEIHEHPYPNLGWSYNNPGLLFLAYLEKKPTDIEGTSFEVDDIKVPVKWINAEHGYLIDDRVLILGKQFLQNADWFDPKGEIYNSDQNQGFGGMNVDGGTGNQGAVEIEAGGSE